MRGCARTGEPVYFGRPTFSEQRDSDDLTTENSERNTVCYALIDIVVRLECGTRVDISIIVYCFLRKNLM